MMKKFDGIKYAKIQKIFFAFKKDELYKCPVYSDSIPKFVTSDYQDYNGNSKYWVPATQAQIDRYDLETLLKEAR